VLAVLFGLTGRVRSVSTARLLQALCVLLRRDGVLVQGLLVVRLTLLGSGCMLGGGEHPPQGRRPFNSEVPRCGCRRSCPDGQRVEGGDRRSLLERLEVEVVIDRERRCEHVLQDLDLLLELCGVLRGLAGSFLGVQPVADLLVLHRRPAAGSGCPLGIPVALRGGSGTPLALPLGITLDLDECGEDSASTGHGPFLLPAQVDAGAAVGGVLRLALSPLRGLGELVELHDVVRADPLERSADLR